MQEMTIDEIKIALERACYADRLLPKVKAQGYVCSMPDIVYTPQEIAFMDRRSFKPKATQEQVSLWEEVILQWLPVLTPEERKLVWKRANRIPWKILCFEFGLHRSKLSEKHKIALAKIQGFLSGQKVRGQNPKKRLQNKV